MESTTGTRPYRMTARARSVEETRQRILDAAIGAFWSAPTMDISLEDLASDASVSVPTVLRHFGSKQGLFEAAVEHESSRIVRQRDEAPPGDVGSAIRVLVEHYEDVGDGVLRLLAEQHREPGLSRIVELGQEAHLRWCERVFGDALASLSGAERGRRQAQLVAVCDIHTWRSLRRDSHLTREQTEIALTELVEHVLEEDLR